MNFLKQERESLVALIPSLDEALAGIPLMEMERPGNPALPIFRELGGPALVIPIIHKGRGATPVQLLRVQRAIASRAPSLAIATTMHHFSVATLVEMVERKSGSGFEWMLLEGIATRKLYVASGFAEGRSGASVLSSALRVERTDAGLVINGCKKPCSLSSSMDLLTTSLLISRGRNAEPELAVATIPADTPGIERRRFWGSPILAGAESDEIIFNDVVVPESLVSYFGRPSQLDDIQTRGFLWFELLIAASYLGIASALVERVLAAGRGGAAERVALVIDVEAMMAALEDVARSMKDEADAQNGLLARALLVRFAVQRAIERATAQAVELLGGMAFINSPEVPYLHAAARGLAFHPPSRLGISTALDRYLSGEPLVIE